MSAPLTIDAREHPISTVTVYQGDRALIQRCLPVKLSAGKNEVVVRFLPRWLFSDSLRATIDDSQSSTSSSQSIRVLDTIHDCSPAPYVSNYMADVADQNRDTTIAKLKRLEKEQEILQRYHGAVQPFGGSGTNNKGTGQVFDPENLAKFLDLYSERQTKLDEAIPKLRQQVNDLSEKARQERKKKVAEEETHSKAKVLIVAKEAGDATLTISYLIGGASWKSVYDLRADLTSSASLPTSQKSKSEHPLEAHTTKRPTVQLQYRASIRQNTSEDWSGVSLLLSTSPPPSENAQIPSAEPLEISIVKPPSGVSRKRKKVGIEAFRDLEADVDSDDDMGFGIFDGDDVPAIEVQRSALSMTYSVSGTSSLKSNNEWQTMTIADLDLPAELEWVTIPSKQTAVFLRCRIENTSQLEFIPGPCNVFLDGSFTSKTTTPSVLPNTSFTYSLGIDPALTIHYPALQKFSSLLTGSLFTNTKPTRVIRYSQTIRIKNARSSKVGKLVVVERIPISKDAEVKVSMIQPDTSSLGPPIPPRSSTSGESPDPNVGRTLIARVSKNTIARWAQRDGEEGGGSRGDGVLEWITDLEPGETRVLELVYEVSAPPEVKWAIGAVSSVDAEASEVWS